MSIHARLRRAAQDIVAGALIGVGGLAALAGLVLFAADTASGSPWAALSIAGLMAAALAVFLASRRPPWAERRRAPALILDLGLLAALAGAWAMFGHGGNALPALAVMASGLAAAALAVLVPAQRLDGKRKKALTLGALMALSGVAVMSLLTFPGALANSVVFELVAPIIGGAAFIAGHNAVLAALGATTPQSMYSRISGR